MKYRNKLKVPILVIGVGEVEPGATFEADCDIMPRYAEPVMDTKEDE